MLGDELKWGGGNGDGQLAASMLDLKELSLGWARLAEGTGVEAACVADGAAFDAAFASAMRSSGLRVIEVMI